MIHHFLSKLTAKQVCLKSLSIFLLFSSVMNVSSLHAQEGQDKQSAFGNPYDLSSEEGQKSSQRQRGNPYNLSDKEGQNTSPDQEDENKVTAISANPDAVILSAGSGALGKALGFKKESGIFIGGVWIPDLNYLIHGGLKPRRWVANNLLQLCMVVDLEKRHLLKGGMVGVNLLQFNGGPANFDAGSVQGYNGLVGPPPLDRFELYEYWYRQELFNKKVLFRIGQMSTMVDFNNVTYPILLQDIKVPATSGLIYVPLVLNASMIGVMPGYYDSAFGAMIRITPVKSFYFSYGVYDGNLARGKQTGMRGPEFNGYYFHITGVGIAWGIKKHAYSGNLTMGGWYQSGRLFAGPESEITEKGIGGFYAFGTQRLWLRNPGKDDTGIFGFFQYGINRSKTLPINEFADVGLTFFGLIPDRPADSIGIGVDWARLNHRIFERKREVMIQTYYQMHVFTGTYFTGVLTYIPIPGAADHLKPAWIATGRLIVLF